MASALAAITVTHESHMHARGYNIFGTVAIGAAPLTYTTGGISMPITGARVKASKPPYQVVIISQCVTAGQGNYEFAFIPGTTILNGFLKIFLAGVELVGGSAIPAAVSSDVVNFEAKFKGMV